MPGELSHGLPPLATSGRAIVGALDGGPVRLRGVNRSGLEYAEPVGMSFLDGARISAAEIDYIVRDWRANIIRLPFNQDWALHGRDGVTADAYLDALDQVIYWASRAGAYTLLDLQWLDADVIRGRNRDGSANRVAALPTRDSITVWATLADRYRDEPAVLFDIFNEPHDPLRDDPTGLQAIRDDGTLTWLEGRRVTMAEWQPWARQLVTAIRREHPRGLVFVDVLPGCRLQHTRLSVVRTSRPRPLGTIAACAPGGTQLGRGVRPPLARGAGVRRGMGWRIRAPALGRDARALLETARSRLDRLELVGLSAARRRRAERQLRAHRIWRSGPARADSGSDPRLTPVSPRPQRAAMQSISTSELPGTPP